MSSSKKLGSEKGKYDNTFIKINLVYIYIIYTCL